MPAVNAASASAPSATGASSFASEADALVSAASKQTGTLDPHLLAQQVSKLTPNQQQGVTAALKGRLSPMQEGQFEHETAKITQSKADADLPKEYVRGADGKLQLSPSYAKEACTNYNKMMASNQKVSDLNGGVGSTLTGGGFASKLLARGMGTSLGLAFGTISGVVTVTTGALAHAPAPPGCVKE